MRLYCFGGGTTRTAACGRTPPQDNVGTMEKKMETTIMGLYRDYRGLYRGYIEIMEQKMETTIWGLGFRVAIDNVDASNSVMAKSILSLHGPQMPK